jgi:hypothetical protein
MSSSAAGSYGPVRIREWLEGVPNKFGIMRIDSVQNLRQLRQKLHDQQQTHLKYNVDKHVLGDQAVSSGHDMAVGPSLDISFRL